MGTEMNKHQASDLYYFDFLRVILTRALDGKSEAELTSAQLRAVAADTFVKAEAMLQHSAVPGFTTTVMKDPNGVITYRVRKSF